MKLRSNCVTASVLLLTVFCWPLLTTRPVLAKDRGVSGKLLAKAARQAMVREIDAFQEDCGSRDTVGEWLTKLTGKDARKVVWSGGPCLLTGPDPLDRGSDWCGQATIKLKNPKSKEDRPMIEVYFEEPVKRRPGKAYAFRGILLTPEGPTYSRFVSEFSSEWRSRFTPDYEPPEKIECEE